jgi:RimJ/RimL family protein N-acetyltransferase
VNLLDNNLRLRPIIMPEDVAIAIPWYLDPEVLYYSEGGESSTKYDSDRVQAMYNYLLNKAEVYIIEVDTKNGWLPIGDVSLFHESGVPIVIGNPEYRSKGIGKRVIQLIINRAKELGRKNISTNGIYTFNERSCRLFESLGFTMVERFIDDDGNECYRFNLVL